VYGLQTFDGLFGRRKIMTSADRITRENVVEELNRALLWHLQNLMEEEYLYWYRRGIHPILSRKKQIRPEICAKIVVNNADMVTTFKNGYFLPEPSTFVSRRDDPAITDAVARVNEYMYAAGAQYAENEVVNWFHTTGLGVLFAEPNEEDDPSRPFNIWSLDPRSAFVVYSLRPGNRPMMGVNVVMTGKTEAIFDIYTPEAFFRVYGSMTGVKVIPDGVPITATGINLISESPNPIGMVPIAEFAYNETRMACFENAIGLMDSIDLAESNRMDGIEQQIQQLGIMYNCQLEEGTTINDINEAGILFLKSVGDNKADFKLLTSTINQQETQTTIDDLYDQMLEKCGVPSSIRDAGSTSDNVGAVYLRNGWAAADTACRCTEDLYRQSKAQITRVILEILRRRTDIDLRVDDMDICFTRSNMDNLLVKTQAALNMKQLGLAPEIALGRSGLSYDPLKDIALSSGYIEKAWANSDNVETVDKTEAVVDEG